MSTPATSRPAENFIALEPAKHGTWGAVAPESRTAEIQELQQNRQVRLWTVRGVVSDHILLAGTPQQIIAEEPKHRLYLNENPLTIYLQRGGWNATYYDFVAGEDRHLDYIEVKVETELPSDALLFARRPLNEMLDVIVRTHNMPLLIKYLVLLSPKDNEPMIYEMMYPYDKGITMGALGGIEQYAPFAPYDAIFREAITNPSPFYQLLCAWRMYDGTNEIRRWLKEQCDKFGIQEKLPSDPKVDQKELEEIGFIKKDIKGVNTAADLFHGLLADHRNAIAHFLFQGDGKKGHVYLADGSAIREYSLGASVLLKYARLTINELRDFYSKHLSSRFSRGSVLPMKEIRDKFNIRDPRLPKQSEQT